MGIFTQKLGQHILRYISKFRRFERDNYFYWQKRNKTFCKEQ